MTARATGLLGLVAGVVALVGNLLAPRFSGDDVDIYRELADSDRYTVAFVVVLVAVLLVTAAFVGIARSGAGELRYYGRLTAVVGGSVALMQVALALFAFRQQAMAFADAPDGTQQVAAFWATNAVDHVNAALFSAWTIALLGLAPLLIGLAQLRDRTLTAPATGLGIVGGVLCVVVGVGELLTDDPSSWDVAFLVGSLLVTLWLFVTSAVLLRSAEVTTP
jgi:hypothetical protein